MLDRVRFYPYKVSYVDLQDYMALSNGQKIPLFTDIIKARNSDDAKSILRHKVFRTIVITSSSRYPKRLGDSIRGIQLTTLNKYQLKAIEREIHGGLSKLPHAINPKDFAVSKPNSTLYTRPSITASNSPVGAPQTVIKSTPIQLTADNPLDIDGFTVGFKKERESSSSIPNSFDLDNTLVTATEQNTEGNPLCAFSWCKVALFLIIATGIFMVIIKLCQ